MQAIGQLFVVVDVVAPLALGFIADRFGVTVAIACLVAQPVTIIACAVLLAPAAPPRATGPHAGASNRR